MTCSFITQHLEQTDHTLTNQSIPKSGGLDILCFDGSACKSIAVRVAMATGGLASDGVGCVSGPCTHAHRRQR